MSSAEFSNLLVSNADYLKPFALTLTRDSDTAMDLMQETLYRALANKEKYNVGTNLKAWLYTIMRNIFINNYRRKARHQVVFGNEITEYLLDSRQQSVRHEGETNLTLKEINTHIHNLPNLFMQPFMLYYEGYKYNEIADYLDEPLGTIKSRIHFARKLLKEQLDRN